MAATRNVLIPVGTDYSPPNKWVTEIHRDWNARYTWPRFVCAVPRDFLAAVRAALAAEGRAAGAGEPGHEPGLHRQGRLLHRHQAGQPGRPRSGSPTGSGSPPWPRCTAPASRTRRVDRAWRQLLYGAHHDAVTGSEGDQVYLDLLAGWRDAWTAGGAVLDAARPAPGVAGGHLRPGVAVTVLNGLAWPRTDLVRVEVPAGDWSLLDDAGAPVPAVLDGRTLSFVARDLPATGWRTYRLVPGRTPRLVAGPPAARSRTTPTG